MPQHPYYDLVALEALPVGDTTCMWVSQFAQLSKQPEAPGTLSNLLEWILHHQDHLSEQEGSAGSALASPTEPHKKLFFIGALGILSSSSAMFKKRIREMSSILLSVGKAPENAVQWGSAAALSVAKCARFGKWTVKHEPTGLVVDVPNPELTHDQRSNIIHAIYHGFYSCEGIINFNLGDAELTFETNVDNDVPFDYAVRLSCGEPLSIRELRIENGPVVVSIDCTSGRGDESDCALSLLLSILERVLDLGDVDE